MISTTRLEAPEEGRDIEEVFKYLRSRGIKVEGRGRKLVYDGKIEVSNQEGYVDIIFEDLTKRGIELENIGDKLVYDGDELDFKITEGDAEYSRKCGISMKESIQVLDFFQTDLKGIYGYSQNHANLNSADPKVSNQISEEA